MTLEIVVDRELWPAEFIPATRDNDGERFTHLSAVEFARQWTKANPGRLTRVSAFTRRGKDVGFAIVRDGEVVDQGGRLS